ncbi:hypothetical protein BOTCAL_0560g00090 [Botryotinia calthae]|uniref:Single-strand DNA deaminase toxin A-like C-terminal domain-containing protein n=1 Tax=Botryotinia calthae TaxID=38488 RepID=A0A4Y8CM18_9HELO|nr:hypothetical protein BOTCAL_0560g00090 [Botryotinia calthae]
MTQNNGSNMPQADSAVPPKQKSRRGRTLRAARSRRNGNKTKMGLKAINTVPVGQEPVMRLSDGSLQAAIEKARPEMITNVDIEATELRKNLAVVQEYSVEATVEKFDESGQSSEQEVECVPKFEEENATDIADTFAEVGTQTELDSFDFAMNTFKEMMEQSERNQKRRHRENEENQERRYQELCAIITKKRDTDAEAYESNSPEINTRESFIKSFDKSREKGCCDVDTNSHSVAYTPNTFAGIDDKTLEPADRSPNTFTDSIDLLISSLEKTSLQHSHEMNKSKYINPDHSRWFRYHQNSTGQYVELCQLVPQVVQSYPIPREKTAIARLNVNGLHRCTAASGWDQPFQNNDIISNLAWTLQVEELCKIINHKLPHRKDLDNGFPGRYHACHAEKQLIAWYLYENTFAGYQVNMQLPDDISYREIKASVPRGALIVVSRKICKDCK